MNQMEWYILYQDGDIESFDNIELWEAEIKRLGRIYEYQIVGKSCYLFDFDFEEIDWED